MRLNLNIKLPKKKTNENLQNEELRKKELRAILNDAYKQGKITQSAFNVGQKEIEDFGTLENVVIPQETKDTSARYGWSYDPNERTFTKGPAIGKQDIVMRGATNRTAATPENTSTKTNVNVNAGIGQTKEERASLERLTSILKTRKLSQFDKESKKFVNIPIENKEDAVTISNIIGIDYTKYPDIQKLVDSYQDPVKKPSKWEQVGKLLGRSAQEITNIVKKIGPGFGAQSANANQPQNGIQVFQSPEDVENANLEDNTPVYVIIGGKKQLMRYRRK